MKKTEGEKEETPKRIHLLPPSTQEVRPVGESYDTILARDHGGPIGANRKDEPKITADEEYSEGKNKRNLKGYTYYNQVHEKKGPVGQVMTLSCQEIMGGP